MNNDHQLSQTSVIERNSHLQFVNTDRSQSNDRQSKDWIKDLEKEFKSRFLESITEQLDKKTEQLKNQLKALKM
jgi:hypothetical protein